MSVESGYLCMTVPEGVHEIRCLFLYGPYVLAALSKEERFLKLDIDPGKAEQEAEKDGLTFCYRGLVWKPLFEIDREPFQVYWEKV